MVFYRVLHKLRFAFAGAFGLAIIFVVSLLISSLSLDIVQAESPPTNTSKLAASMSNSPNAVTSGMSQATESLSEVISNVGYTTLHTVHGAATAIADGGMAAARGAQTGATAAVVGMGKGLVAAGKGIATAGKGVLIGVGFVGQMTGSGVGFLLKIPGSAANLASNAPVLKAVIKPTGGHEDIPIIDPNSPELLAALTAMPPNDEARAEESPANEPTPSEPAPVEHGPIWPINGRVTAEFGVPHRPFQHTHTGIDISSGQRSGVTPVKPFRPGRVIETNYSRHGLGNHVIVDHGSGVTSVYAHFSSISVQAGQEVGVDTVLGFEGTTGASTGTHLHFEIRVNGQATNPRQFIGGNP